MNLESRVAIEWALKQFTDPKAAARRRLYHRYYNGDHQLNFATDKFLATFGLLFQALSENLCPLAVDPLADLLQVDGFLPTNVRGKRQIAAIQTQINEVWRSNRMKARSGQIHKEALLFEETFVIVWPDLDDPKFPVIYTNEAGSVAGMSHPTKLGYFIQGAKWWFEKGRVRLNLYFLDRIEKWVSTNAQTWLPVSPSSFVPFYEPNNSEPWPLPNPYGKVPLFRFVNDPDIKGTGKGELRDVIPLQNALNKLLCDMMVGSEFEAFAQRYAIGFEPEKDAKGNAVNPFKAGAGNLWILKNKDGKFGEFSRGDITKFIAGQDSIRTSIARVSRTPVHQIVQLSSGWPSGESLKTACEPITNKAFDRQTTFGGTWEDVARFALEICGRPGVALDSLWRDPTPRPEELAKWQATLAQQNAGVGVNQTLRERGYSDDEIASWAQEEVPGDGGQRDAKDLGLEPEGET